MQTIPFEPDEIVHALLALSRTEHVSILDSCGVGHLGSHLMIAGLEPVKVIELKDDAALALETLDEIVNGDLAAIFTLSYDLGLKLQNLESASNNAESSVEPFAFITCFDALIVHDYDDNQSYLVGNESKFDRVLGKIESQISNFKFEISNETPRLSSSFSKPEYLAAIEEVKERIREGDTYQTNITRQIKADLPANLTPDTIFARLRRDHPAPFAAFIKRNDSTVISASPERFFKITQCESPRVSEGDSLNVASTALADARASAIEPYKSSHCESPRVSEGDTPNVAITALANARASATEPRRITTSPIKGTRPRGRNIEEDNRLRQELINSPKDRAENTMIVDLLRNDLGRVCEYGSVVVEKLCDLEEHPSLFHLVSTVSGDLRSNVNFSDILRALFPCGSITGAPKISTMKIIDQIEPTPRGLSMGAIGVYVPSSKSQVPSVKWPPELATLDLSVAIRTAIIRGQTATFNVGGGIVIDSDPESEYEETITKATALLSAIGNAKARA